MLRHSHTILSVGGRSADMSLPVGWSCVGLLLAARMVWAFVSFVQQRSGPSSTPSWSSAMMSTRKIGQVWKLKSPAHSTAFSHFAGSSTFSGRGVRGPRDSACFCVGVPRGKDVPLRSVCENEAPVQVGGNVLPLLARWLDHEKAVLFFVFFVFFVDGICHKTSSIQVEAFSFESSPSGQACRETSIRVHPRACTSGWRNVWQRR